MVLKLYCFSGKAHVTTNSKCVAVQQLFKLLNLILSYLLIHLAETVNVDLANVFLNVWKSAL